MSTRKRLLFVSPRFLFPADSGGKIRTAQVLRGMKGGEFEITLLSPEPPDGSKRFAAELAEVCDRYHGWPEPVRGRWFNVTRMRLLASRLPVSVATDRSTAGSTLVARELGRSPDVAVFDFVHSAVLVPPTLETGSVLFTHNVESEIFARHAQTNRDRLKRAVWKNQWRKMCRFERDTLRRFDRVVAVSERDAAEFHRGLGVNSVAVIPTGVDLDYYAYAPPRDAARVVFTGSMDWPANIDGIEFMLEEVWPLVLSKVPQASMVVVGRHPPPRLLEKVRNRGLRWTFTGFVDDVRPYVHDATVYVIPLRVGGGTRIKAYEAMALGCPVVSTAIGVEGLPVTAGEHYLSAESAANFAEAVVALIQDADRRMRLSTTARRYVETHCSYRRVAQVFEAICRDAAIASKGEIR